MATIYIDHQPFEVNNGKNLLEACLSLGINLPYFCWHPAMGSVGACRQCAVKVYKDENDATGRLVMSCMEPVKDNLYLSVNDPVAKDFRAQVIEWLMTNHPHDCAVCDEGGACHLQDMTVMTGHTYRRFNYKKRSYHNQYLGPFINHEMNRCIQCYRCVRYYKDYAGGKDLDVFAAHDHVYFGRATDGVLESEFSGNLVEVCPTGVFTDKSLKEHYTRKWDMTMAPSICQHCSLGCNIIAGERYGELRQITNRFNEEVNGYFLCDRGRFGYEFVNSINRIQQPLIRSQVPDATSRNGLFQHIKQVWSSRQIIGIGSPRACMEANFALMQLVGKDNFYQGVAENEASLTQLIVDALGSGQIYTPSLKEIAHADVILILGEDVTNTAPVMALAIRQALRKTTIEDAQHIGIPAWHDAAVRALAQQKKGAMFQVFPTATKLDEVAERNFYMAPDDIASLAYSIAEVLNKKGSLGGLNDDSGDLMENQFADENAPVGSFNDEAEPVLRNNVGDDAGTSGKVSDEVEPVKENKIDDDQAAWVDQIASALKSAAHPLIICGTTLGNEGIIKAAIHLAQTLNASERKISVSFVVPECNSMGLAMMGAKKLSAANASLKKQEADAVIVLENDLYRRAAKADVDKLFNHCKEIIVLDTLHHETSNKASVLIPVATFAEGDGTLINNEGRAQRFFQVFKPKNDSLRESWRWLDDFRQFKYGVHPEDLINPDDLMAELVSIMPQFKGAEKTAPDADFRMAGQKIPREPHRYSGRTAMLANLNVNEPKPPEDPDSPLSFTMEGYRGQKPAPLTPFFWSPGWNSVQAVNKYQVEVGGPLKNVDSGKRLFPEKSVSDISSTHQGFGGAVVQQDDLPVDSVDREDDLHLGAAAQQDDVSETFAAKIEKWTLVPLAHIFGSEELSIYTPGIAERAPQPYIMINPLNAAALNCSTNDILKVRIHDQVYDLSVKFSKEIPAGVAGIPQHIGGLTGIVFPARATLIKII